MGKFSFFLLLILFVALKRQFQEEKGMLFVLEQMKDMKEHHVGTVTDHFIACWKCIHELVVVSMLLAIYSYIYIRFQEEASFGKDFIAHGGINEAVDGIEEVSFTYL